MKGSAAGCPSCSAIADGFAVHLANHGVMLSAVSRAPLAKLQRLRAMVAPPRRVRSALTDDATGASPWGAGMARREGFEPPTYRSVVCRSAEW